MKLGNISSTGMKKEKNHSLIIVDFGIKDYEESYKMLEEYHKKSKKYKKNYLLLGSHFPIYTVGSQKDFMIKDAFITDRGGSITYHDEGCLICYFSFLVPYPARFYSNVIKALKIFFSNFSDEIYYDSKKPGFYIENRKIASLGFRYKDNISKHGVSIHINPNLENFNKIKPCGLEGVVATSLYKEGYEIDFEDAKDMVKKAIFNVFKA